MAKVHSKLKNKTSKASTTTTSERFYTVGYTPNGGDTNPRPQLTIKGRWLELLGFYPRLPVTITTEKGLLIIKLAMQS